MPFPRPTLSALRQQVYARFLANLPGADTALRRSNIRVSADVMAGLANGEYGYIDWIVASALLPDTAIEEYLYRWGALKGLTPYPPIPASGNVTITGSINGTPIPSGTILQLPPVAGQIGNPPTYATTATVTLASGTATAPIAALLPNAQALGSQWNVDAGATLGFVTAIAGINGIATVVANIANGVDPESDNQFRVRVLLALRQPPQGGDQNDYREWALAVAGITRVWPIANGMGSGTVAVYFMMDQVESGHGGFPQGTNGVATAETRAAPATGDQLALANALFVVQPVTAMVYAMAPVAAPQNFTLKNVASGSQAAVTAALAGVIQAEGAADGSTLSLADIEAAVRLVVPAALITVPSADIVAAVGYLPTLGTVSYV